MARTPLSDTDQHFTGVNTRLLIAYLQRHASQRNVAEVLRRAGEERPLDDLLDRGRWSSYDQVRRLFVATAEVLGSLEVLRSVGRSCFEAGTPATLDMLQRLKSPTAFYESSPQVTVIMGSVIETSSEPVGPNEYLIRFAFREGFRPFREYCHLWAGMVASAPPVFGYPEAVVVEEQCQCFGAPTCVFRASWEAIDEPAQQAAYFKLRATLLEDRIEELQLTIADVVAGNSLGTTLSGIVAAAARAVSATACVLALDPLPGLQRDVYASGMAEPDARRVAADMLALPQVAGDVLFHGRLVTEIVSERRRYGRLVALYPAGQPPLAQELGLLEVYGRLAAASLDSATAIEASRRQTATTRSLLDLATGLSEMRNSDGVARHLAAALPDVIGCDQAVVVIFDHEGAGRIAACHGLSPDGEVRLRELAVPPAEPGALRTDVTFYDRTSSDIDPAFGDMMTTIGSQALIVVPIVSNGEQLGRLAAGVRDHPERLHPTGTLLELVQGVASQGATALRNARLNSQIRHSAHHDSLTGLPNRSLILDRAEQALGRARSAHNTVALLFVDLDGFKKVNDTLGHAAGDQVLRAVSRRLRGAMRSTDTVGRLGGDEFVVLVDGPPLEAGAQVMAERLLDALGEPFVLDSTTHAPLRVTASIGIALGDRGQAEELLHDADIAMYQAKAAGKNRFAVFHPDGPGPDLVPPTVAAGPRDGAAERRSDSGR